jgi:uncharacterized RDD family membrane protein YckC
LTPVPPPTVTREPAWAGQPEPDDLLMGPAGLRIAGRRRRVAGFLLDVLALTLAGFAYWSLVQGLAGDPLVAGSAADVAGTIGFMGLSLAYWVVLWVRAGGTLGQRLLGMRVVDAATGERIAWQPAIRRWLLFEGVTNLLLVASLLLPAGATLPGLILDLGAVGWPLLLLATTVASPTRQGLHDRYARTLVVRHPAVA